MSFRNALRLSSRTVSAISTSGRIAAVSSLDLHFEPLKLLWVAPEGQWALANVPEALFPAFGTL